MSNEALNSTLPSSMRFDDLGALEITDPSLLSAVAAGGGGSPGLRHNQSCGSDSECMYDTVCTYDGGCVFDSNC